MIEGMSPFESMAAAGKIVSPAKEFGGGRDKPNFLRDELDASQRDLDAKKEMAQAKAKARLEDEMKDKLGGKR